jgi:hypothetical protein
MKIMLPISGKRKRRHDDKKKKEFENVMDIAYKKNTKEDLKKMNWREERIRLMNSALHNNQ